MFTCSSSNLKWRASFSRHVVHWGMAWWTLQMTRSILQLRSIWIGEKHQKIGWSIGIGDITLSNPWVESEIKTREWGGMNIRFQVILVFTRIPGGLHQEPNHWNYSWLFWLFPDPNSTGRDPFPTIVGLIFSAHELIGSEEAHAYLTYAYRAMYVMSHRISSSLVGLVGVSHCHRRLSHFFWVPGYLFLSVLLWLSDARKNQSISKYDPIHGEATLFLEALCPLW